MIKQNRPARRGDDRGAGLVEYALLLALIVITCIAALTYFGGRNNSGLQRSKDCIINAETPPPGC